MKFVFIYRVVLPILIAMASMLIANYSVNNIAWIGHLEKQASLSNQSNHPINPLDNILIIELTPNSKASLPEGSIRDTTVEDIHALIAALESVESSTVLIDVVFPRNGNDENAPVTNEANKKLKALLKTLKRTKVVLGMIYIDRSMFPTEYEGLVDESEPNGVKAFTRPVAYWSGPATSNVHPGLIENTVVNGVYSGAILARLDFRTNRTMLYAPLAAYLLSIGLDPRDISIDRKTNSLVIGGNSWLLDGNSGIDARYTEDPNPFLTIDYKDAMERLRNGGQDFFENKIILFGEAKFGTDVVMTSRHDQMPGLIYLAHMVNTIDHVRKNNVKVRSLWEYHAYPFAVAFLISAFLLSSRKWLAIFGSLSIVVLGLFLPPVSESMNWYYVETVAPMIAIVLSLLMSVALMTVLGFNRDMRVDGQVYEATVVFGDVIDSTPNLISKGRAQFQMEMKRLHKQWHTLAWKHGGTIERTLGDGFIAVFRDSRRKPNCALRALSFVKDNDAGMTKLRHLGETDLQMSFGMETGQISGHFVIEGGHRNWTSTGETVVLAQRVQSACRDFQATLIIGPTALRSIGLPKGVQKKEVVVKGFRDPVSIAILMRKDVSTC